LVHKKGEKKHEQRNSSTKVSKGTFVCRKIGFKRGKEKYEMIRGVLVGGAKQAENEKRHCRVKVGTFKAQITLETAKEVVQVKKTRGKH